VSAEFKGRINGVTRAGLFVTLDETGADGFIPMRSLGDDYYIHDETRHCLRGRRTGRVYTMGDAVTARLSEADTVTGSLQFALTGDADRPGGGKTPQRSGRRRR
jgi:ribonuclease R